MQGWLILRSHPEYADFTQGQYQAALELLKNTGALVNHSQSWILAENFRSLPTAQVGQIIFENIIELSAPAWLPDSDLLLSDHNDLPEDAVSLATAFGLDDAKSFGAIQNVHTRIDLIRRKEIGDAGESELLKFLEKNWQGSTAHVASVSDWFGYDIAFQHGGSEWHFEVKSTTRRGRMNIYLSRNEFEKSRRDPMWRLIIAGLDQSLKLIAIATLRDGHLEMCAPSDCSSKAKWQSAAFEIAQDCLLRGICLDDRRPNQSTLSESLELTYGASETWFGWLP